MADKNQRTKLIVAIVVLVVAAVILAIQYWPDSGASKQAQAASANAAQTTVKTDKTGAKEIKQGSRAWKEDAPK